MLGEDLSSQQWPGVGDFVLTRSSRGAGLGLTQTTLMKVPDGPRWAEVSSIFGITGPSGCGTSTLADALEEY